MNALGPAAGSWIITDTPFVRWDENSVGDDRMENQTGDVIGLEDGSGWRRHGDRLSGHVSNERHEVSLQR